MDKEIENLINQIHSIDNIKGSIVITGCGISSLSWLFGISGTSNTIILGTIIFSYLPMIIASVPNYFYFTLFFIPIGIGAGLIFPVLNSQMAIIEQKTKRILIPFTQACFSAGSLSGALVAALFIKLIPDPRITFFIVGTLFFIYAICF